MKILTALILISFFNFSFSYGAAREKSLGLGISLGPMAGISLKTWRGPESAIDAIFSWDKSKFVFSVGFLRHIFSGVEEGYDQFPLYYGLGSKVEIKNDDPDSSTVGIRFSGGISYLLPAQPLDLFLELVPVLGIVPDTDLKMEAAAGFRYYF